MMAIDDKLCRVSWAPGAPVDSSGRKITDVNCFENGRLKSPNCAHLDTTNNGKKKCTGGMKNGKQMYANNAEIIGTTYYYALQPQFSQQKKFFSDGSVRRVLNIHTNNPIFEEDNADFPNGASPRPQFCTDAIATHTPAGQNPFGDFARIVESDEYPVLVNDNVRASYLVGLAINFALWIARIDQASGAARKPTARATANLVERARSVRLVP